ncbi:MAG TPA: single-stranded-DNA-specific exonuclease RecJ [Chiayiivirga sp.]|nr:single-stranded-DNA-specific exonuclease RecJ [Chiayiivirga sp.]
MGPRICRREALSTHPWPATVHPVLQRVYAARGVNGPDQVQHRLQGLLTPQNLGGLPQAVALLIEAIDKDWRICVVGDFDADGATGTAVAVRGLRLLGARAVSFKVPHRMRHGYGLSRALVDDLPSPKPELLITVDNGVSSLDGVAAAKALGIKVIVTDHHLPGADLPQADAMVNPNLEGDGFPSKALAGVGVVFYLLLALRARLREQGAFAQRAEPELSCLLDLVALGTVADMVALDHNNRILVSAGLRRMRTGHAQVGVQALLKVSGRSLATLNSADLGFALGPRLNAAGRLEDMALGIQCLLSDDPVQALELARQLDGINQERRALQDDMLQQAESAAQACLSAMADGDASAALCVFEPDWHAGVIGLVASRLKDRLHRPVIAFAPGGEDGLLRGSARSITGFHMRDALADVAAMHPGLMVRFGGHAMAAGLSLAPEQLDAFRAAFAALADARLSPEMLQAVVWSDGVLDAADFSRDLAEQLRGGGPWGQGFPEPAFDGEFECIHWRRVGNDHLKMRVRPRGSTLDIDAIQFNGFDGQAPAAQLHLVYQLATDDFRERRGIQLLVQQRIDLS